MNESECRHFDVAVIGGGIAGLACARELASAGRKVVVYERAAGLGASWAAAGMLTPWGAAIAANARMQADDLAMLEQAFALYPSWIEGLEFDTGMPIDMDRRGALVVSFPGEEPAAARLPSLAPRAPGFRALRADEARLESPLLGPEIQDAALLPEEGYADPRTIMPALREACRSEGVIIREEEIVGLTEENGAVRGVRSASGVGRAEAVVNAAGAWAAPFLGGDCLRPIRGQILSLRPPSGAEILTQVIQSGSGYLVPRGDGSIVVGATSEDVGFEIGVTEEGVRSLLETARKIAPSLASWTLDRAWSGLRPYREGGPLIGPDERRRGLYHVAGLYRHGILLAPYAAYRIRECMGCGVTEPTRS